MSWWKPDPKKPRDPICGMEVDPARAVGTSERDGRTFYFCSPACKARFDAQGR